MAEFRITVGSNSGGRGLPAGPPGPRGKFAILKSLLIAVLALSLAVGVLLTVLIIGSAIATILLVVVAVAVIVGLGRWFLMWLARKWRDRRFGQ